MKPLLLVHRTEPREEGPGEGTLHVILGGDELVELDPLNCIRKVVERIAEPGIFLEAADEGPQRPLDGPALRLVGETGLRLFQLRIDVVRGPPFVREPARVQIGAADDLAFHEIEIVAEVGLAEQPDELGARPALTQRLFAHSVHAG